MCWGLLEKDADEFLHSAATQGDDDVDIDALIEARNAARENKNWAEADRIRNELDAMGIVLEDKNGKTNWRRS